MFEQGTGSHCHSGRIAAACIPGRTRSANSGKPSRIVGWRTTEANEECRRFPSKRCTGESLS